MITTIQKLEAMAERAGIDPTTLWNGSWTLLAFATAVANGNVARMEREASQRDTDRAPTDDTVPGLPRDDCDEYVDAENMAEGRP